MAQLAPNAQQEIQWLQCLCLELCLELRNHLEFQRELAADATPASETFETSHKLALLSPEQPDKLPSFQRPEQRPEPSKPTHTATDNPKNTLLASFQALRKREQAKIQSLDEKKAAFSSLKTRVQSCHRCPLNTPTTEQVWGLGGLQPKMIFLAPGANPQESQDKRIFTGEAAELIDKIVVAMCQQDIPLKADEIYYSNLIKCSQRCNRQAASQAALACCEHWREELNILSPQVVILWGELCYQTVFGKKLKLLQARGQVHYFEHIPCIPTHHPLEMLKNPQLKARVWADLRLALHRLKA